MATHGTVSKFQPKKEDWSTYVEQLTFYFAANGVTEDKQQSSILRHSYVQTHQELTGGRQDPDNTVQGPGCTGTEPLRTETVGDRPALQIQHPFEEARRERSCLHRSSAGAG